MVRDEKPAMNEEESRNINRTIYILVFAVILALLIAAAIYYIRKWLAGRKKEKEPEHAEIARRAAFNARKPGEFVCLTYAAMCGELARLGYSRAPSETPTEYLWRINDRVPSVEKEAGNITRALMDVLYAGQVPESGRPDAAGRSPHPGPRQSSRASGRRSRCREHPAPGCAGQHPSAVRAGKALASLGKSS